MDYETKDTYIVTVTVTDGKDADDNVDLTVDDTIRVTITVMDVNDAPEFATKTATRSVAENTVVEANIGNPVVATDDDGHTLTYTLDTTDGDFFAIDPLTGQLKTKAALDYEKQTDYEVTVTARDTSLTGTITVTINVRNVSVANGDTEVANSAPAFTDGPSTTREVDENTKAKANIGAPVAARDVDRGDTLTYTLGGTHADSFAIDEDTGQLKTKDELDHEHETGDTYMVMVTVTDGKDAENNVDNVDDDPVDDDTITVTITVTDVNEPPMFPDAIPRIDVAENTAAGANIPDAVVVATDVDSGDTADTLTYTLGGTHADSFAIDDETGQLQTKAALDYETQTDHEVTVIATDTGGLMGEITVTINVTDVLPANGDTAVANSAPAFTIGPSTTLSVDENTAADINIGPVTATDVDIGDALTYVLRGADAASFDIDETGQLKTKAALDHEDKDTYMVTVTVTDGRDAEKNVDPAVDDEIRVTITVTDVNEAPAFATKTATRSVAENTSPAANIGAPVVAMDVDGDTLTYMLGGTDATSFVIDPATGQLKTMEALDYETKTDYEVTVTARDNGTPTMAETTITVTINVRNVSVGDTAVVNSAPAFNDGPSTTRSVDENTKADMNIGDPVAAMDVDGDTLTYTLDDTGAESFDFDSTTGQLKTKEALDHEHETNDTYMVTVTVTDGKNATGGVETAVDDTITVTIMVTDVNEAPAFADEPPTPMVAENTVASVNIPDAVVVAMDEDDGDTLTYTLGGTDAASFDIESTTTGGQLKTLAALDYETQRDYEVMVIATDDGVPPLTGTITVTINVGNVEVAAGDTAVANSAPWFNDGPSTTREVDENTVAGEDIGDVNGGEVDAMDLEDPPRALTYVLSGADADSFGFDSTTGRLKTKAALDHEDKETYMVTVTVTDGKDADDNVSAAVDDTITVTITVMDVNEAPVFPDTIAPIVVAENTGPGTNIGAPVIATDVDSGDTLTYTLGVTDTDSFDIDADTGQLKTKAALDYERQTDYEVMVIATDTGDDGGAGALTGTITVTINVRNVSVGDTEVANRAPAFNDGPSTTRSVDENTKAKANIGAPVVATDDDRGDTLTYTLVDAATAAFAIDEDTGQLKTKAALDHEHETNDTYMVMVTVTDGKNAEGTVDDAVVDDTITVTITVTDVNEAPMFPAATIPPIKVAENTAAGANIGAPVVATDVDSGDTADTLTYTLDGTDADSFAIESTADGGQLQTKAPLDYETKTDYEVMVIATDDGVPPLTGTITVTINVENVEVAAGDTAVANSEPAFNDGPSTTRSVDENTAAGVDIRAPVLAMKALLAEDDSADTLTYGLLPGADAASFDIESTTAGGQLKTKAALNHEDKPSYMVTVTVTDGKDAEDNFDPAVDDTIRVTIMVTDVNEAPAFATETATRSVDENTAAGEDIGLPVVATDVDDDTLTYALGGTHETSFAIESTTTGGQLQTLAALDYETQTDYEVTVIATDDGGTLSDEITVTINVADVSVANGDDAVANSAPWFNDGLRTTRSVRENTAAGVDIGDPVEATDSNTGDALTYTLVDAATAAFAIDEDTGQLETKDELDYETTTSYMVTVTVSDGKNDLNNVDAEVDDRITVTIRVANEVEDPELLNRPPRFLMESITLEVAENTAADENIGEPILAFDPDTADSLTYGFDGDDAAKFTVDEGSNTALFTFNSETGQLKTNRAIPSYEVARGYMVMLTVKDSKDEDDESDADEVADSEIDVTITVTDASDRPAFASDETGERSVAENTAAGEDIGDPFTATDADTDAVVTYTLGGADSGSFDIDEDTGQLKTKAALDYEVVPAKTSYMVTVTATNDDAADPLSSKISVTITVTDVNEADPAFATETATRMVDENTAAGEDIGAPVVATDVDSGDTLTYTLGGTDAASFDIDPDTGQLETKEELNYEVVPAKTSYMVTVTVTDGKDAEGNVDTAADDTITVTITVTDVNEVPEFADETATRSIAENTATDMAIGDPVAAMEDVDSGDTLTYTLGGTDAASFDIDPDTGQLKTNVALDFETQTDYEVTVTATDTGGETDTITVTIQVTDVSVANGDTAVANSAPVFDDGPSTTREIAENTAAGEAIGLPVVATDVDSGDTLTYTLDGTDAASFAIVETSGQLQTRAALDFETKFSYMVTVTVGDGTAEDSIDVTITVTDDPSDDDTTVNNPPTFDVSSPVSYSIVAGGSGRTVGSPTATDPEGDPLTYAITSGNDS